VASLTAEEIAETAWAGAEGLLLDAGCVRTSDGRRLPFLHWAGMTLEQELPWGEIFCTMRDAGEARVQSN
jgi:hypothetical protein